MEAEMAAAETLALSPVQDPEAPLDAPAIRSRFEQLLALSKEAEEVPLDAAEEEDAVRGLQSKCKVDVQAMDEWDSGTAELGTDGLAAYMEWLRTKLSLTEEENRELSAEISHVGETLINDKILMEAEIEATESSLDKIDSEGLKQLEASSDTGLSPTDVDKDYIYEVLELDYQIEKNEMDLKLSQIQNTSMQRDEEMWQLESVLSVSKVLEYKGSCLKVFLKAPILTPECVYFGQKLDSVVDSFVSDHELLIEFDEGSMELKKVQIFPADVCVDTLIEKLKSSREIISVPSLGWLIWQCQQQIIINILRRSLVSDANSSRHSFEYLDKDETIVAHLVGAIDAFFKISADWPLSSGGLKLMSIRNSGTQPTNITLNLLCKTKELANGLELQTRQNLLRFVDAVEEILLREMQSELHSSRVSG